MVGTDSFVLVFSQVQNLLQQMVSSFCFLERKLFIDRTYLLQGIACQIILNAFRGHCDGCVSRVNTMPKSIKSHLCLNLASLLVTAIEIPIDVGRHSCQKYPPFVIYAGSSRSNCVLQKFLG